MLEADEQDNMVVEMSSDDDSEEDKGVDDADGDQDVQIVLDGVEQNGMWKCGA